MTIPFAPNPHTLFDLSDITADKIDFRHIARSLSGMNRFNGSVPFTVAQHSLAVASIVEDRAKPWALLHDAHEAYTGDIPGPVKTWIKEYVGSKFDTPFHKIDYAIADAGGIVHLWADPQVIGLVKLADKISLQAEMDMWFDKAVLTKLGSIKPEMDLRPFIEIKDPYAAFMGALQDYGVRI